ncbi:MAG: SDR family oxidoreductase [Rhodospirillaceae bacterium]|nr:SDR family oxidoreductase [Rhodospirillaceae bacterium]
MPTVLVTGANRGIGLEWVRQYAGEGWRVLAGCRRPDRADALKAIEGDVTIHPVDVARPDHIADWARRLKGQPIDILINNAGHGGDDRAADPGEWTKATQVNVIGPFLMAREFQKNVAASDRKMIVNLTSRMGSIGDNSEGGSYAYRATKAGLNATMKSLAVDWKETGITIVLFHPGWVQTDMGGPDALIDVETSVTGMRKKMDQVTPADSGSFFNYKGDSVPW